MNRNALLSSSLIIGIIISVCVAGVILTNRVEIYTGVHITTMGKNLEEMREIADILRSHVYVIINQELAFFELKYRVDVIIGLRNYSAMGTIGWVDFVFVVFTNDRKVIRFLTINETGTYYVSIPWGELI